MATTTPPPSAPPQPTRLSRAPFDWSWSAEIGTPDPYWWRDVEHYGPVARLHHPTTMGQERATVARVTVHMEGARHG